jgi:hypothetical protein
MPTPYPRTLTPSSDAHEERLLDDAIDDTFPASDPISHGQPGSIVNTRYAAMHHGAREAWWNPTSRWILIGAAAALGYALARRR